MCDKDIITTILVTTILYLMCDRDIIIDINLYIICDRGIFIANLVSDFIHLIYTLNGQWN